MNAWRVLVHPDVVARDLKGLDRSDQERLLTAMEGRLATAPDRLGAALRRDLKGFRKLRVGDYRIVYRLAGRDVHVLGVGHRRHVYAWIRSRVSPTLGRP